MCEFLKRGLNFLHVHIFTSLFCSQKYPHYFDILQRVDFEQANNKVHAKLSGRKLESNRPLVKSA